MGRDVCNGFHPEEKKKSVIFQVGAFFLPFLWFDCVFFRFFVFLFFFREGREEGREGGVGAERASAKGLEGGGGREVGEAEGGV